MIVPRPFAAVLLIILCGVLLAQSTASNGAVNASGGNITPVNFVINASSDRWFFFYGNTSGNTNGTLTLNSSLRYNSSDATSLLSLPSTYVQYLISDSSSPFNGSLHSPDLDAFNDQYNLSGLSAVQNFFNISHDFSVLVPGTTGPAALDLPAIDLPGYTSNGSLQPFYEGIAQTDSSFVFLVPISTQAGFDNRTFDYEFVLPYNLPGNNSFYIFSQVAPVSETAGGQPTLPPVDYQWSYSEGTGLTIDAPPGATIILHDALGQVYNVVSGAGGSVNLAGLLPGMYTLKIVAPGFQMVLETLYIPAPLLAPPPPPPSPSNAPNNLVTFQQTPQGTVMCIDADCYLVPNASLSDLQKLSEISCTGSLCRLVTENQTLFVQQHHLKAAGTVVVPQQLAPPAGRLSQLL